MTSVLIKRGNLDRDRHTVRTPCRDEGREQADEIYKAGNDKDLQQTTRSWKRGTEKIFPQHPQKEPSLPTP